jgi:O-antigen ligase
LSFGQKLILFWYKNFNKMIDIEWKYINNNTFFYSLLIVGFIAISTIPSNFSIESSWITVPFRFFVLFYSIFLIVNNLYKRQFKNLEKSDYFFFIFWLLYLINVYFSFRSYTFSSEVISKEIEIYIRIVGICFVPSIAIFMLNEKNINYNVVFNMVYCVIYTILFINIVVGIGYDFQGRSSGFLSMYSISFGHVGVTLALMSVYYIMFKKICNLYVWIIMLTGLLIGTYIMYASGTRSPLIGYLVCINYMFFIRKKYVQLFALFFILVLGISLLIYVNPHYSEVGGSSFFSRLLNMIVAKDSSGRGELYKEGLRIFFNKPLFGGRFLFFDGFYPHNIFIEILMSMGLFGLVIFFMFFKNCVALLFKFKRLIENSDKLWIVVLWLQNFILALFSYNLYGNSLFWYFTAMILVINKSISISENKIIN